MKKRLIYLAVILLLGVGLVLYFWQPWQARQENVDFDNAGEILKACQAKTAQLSSYRYQTNIKVGKQISVAITDKVEQKPAKRQMIDFSWDVPQMSGTATMYTEGQKIYVFHPLKDKWILPDEDPTISPFMDFFWRQLGLVNPVENVLKIDAQKGNFSIYPEGSDEGSDSVAIQVTPQPGALSEINKSLPPQFKGAALADVRQIFWISKQDLLVTRYEVRAKVAVFGFNTMDFRTVSEPAEYDKTQIKLPKPLVDKMKQG